MSYGRRLALFFVLIVLVPTLALLALLVIVSDDSREGKADARLAAGLDTASAVYKRDVSDAEADARQLAGDPGLAAAVLSADRASLDAIARDEVGSGVTAVEILDRTGDVAAAAGPDDAIAFADLRLARDGEPVGTLRVTNTTAPAYADQVRGLTGRELVVSRNGKEVAGTVTAPATPLTPGETSDVDLPEGDFRGHLQTLDTQDDETLLLLGPRNAGGFLAIGRAATLILVGFLLLAVLLAYVLTRTLQQLHEQVSQQALTDPLTGLANRRRLAEQLDREADRAVRFDHPLSLLVLDVDDFKTINDLRGHLQGDAVLRAIADVVKRETRSIDLAARYGGDELALILIETRGPGGELVAERICTMVRESEVPLRDGGTMGVTASVGVATLPGAANDGESLLDAADKALLQAKRAGKDQIRVAPVGRFEPSGRRRATSTRGI